VVGAVKNLFDEVTAYKPRGTCQKNSHAVRFYLGGT
jgi:hypothetical protein